MWPVVLKQCVSVALELRMTIKNEWLENKACLLFDRQSKESGEYLIIEGGWPLSYEARIRYNLWKMNGKKVA